MKRLSLASLVLAIAAWLGGVMAQAPREPVVIPFHGDPRVRVERPDGPTPRSLRIVTDDEFPPLHFTDAEGQPAGFSVELARAVCEKLQASCTIQIRRFDTLLPALGGGQADLVAAAIPVTAELKARFNVSRVYHRLPARFMGRQGFGATRIDQGLAGIRVAVVRETAHEAYLAERFPQAQRIEASDLDDAIRRHLADEAELVFGDGQALALWLGGPAGRGHRFAGGPFYSTAHFGEGIGFVVRREDPNLKRAIDFALQSIWDDGTYARLFLRAFPVSPF